MLSDISSIYLLSLLQVLPRVVRIYLLENTENLAITEYSCRELVANLNDSFQIHNPHRNSLMIWAILVLLFRMISSMPVFTISHLFRVNYSNSKICMIPKWEIIWQIKCVKNSRCPGVQIVLNELDFLQIILFLRVRIREISIYVARDYSHSVIEWPVHVESSETICIDLNIIPSLPIVKKSQKYHAKVLVMILCLMRSSMGRIQKIQKISVETMDLLPVSANMLDICKRVHKKRIHQIGGFFSK